MAFVFEFNSNGELSSDKLKQEFVSYEVINKTLIIEAIEGKEVIDLEKNGILFTKGRYELNSDSFSYKDARFFFSNITAEMYIRSLSDKSLFEAVERNKGFDAKIGGVSPDILIVEPSLSLPGKAVEFKSTLGEFTESKMAAINEEMLLKYGSIGSVIIIYLELGFDFAKQFKLPKPHIGLYNKLRNDLALKRNNQQDRTFLMFDEGTTVPPGLDIIKSLDLVSDETGYLSERVSYMGMDKIIYDTLSDFKRYENMFNDNYLEQKLAAEIVFRPSIRQSNIFSQHAWDRDLNKERTLLLGGPSGDVGRRSTYLFHIPIFKSLKFTSTELSEVASLVRSKEFSTYLGLPELATLIKTVVRVSFVYQIILNKIRDLQSEVAFLETEATKSSFDDNLNISMGVRIKELHNEIKVMRDTRLDDEEESFKITQSGYIRVPIKGDLKYFTGINRDFEKFNKSTFDSIEIDDFEFDFDSILNLFDTLPKLDFDATEPYGKHPSELGIFRAQGVSKRRLDAIWTSRIHWYLYNFWKVARAYVAAYPGLTGRRTQSNDFRVVKVDDLPIYLMVSPSPNAISTGTIISISKHEKGSSLPAFCLPHERYDVDDNTWFVSKPFRYNRKILIKFDEIIGSFYGTCTLMNEYGISMYKNAFYCSLYYNYSRQVSLALDALYLLYKNSPNLGSLGRKEYGDKFKDLYIKDIRVAHLISKMLKGYQQFSDCMSNFAANFNRKTLVPDEPNSVLTIKDPVFNLPIENMQTFLTLTYMKQIIPKNDGYDEAKVAGTFFEKEMDFQNEYENSKFNNSNLDYKKSLSVKDFNDRVFKNQEGTEWEKITYHPDSCYRLVRNLLNTAFEGVPPLDPIKDFKAAETGKNTRVLMPSHLTRRSLEDEEIKTSYQGIESTNLTEAIHIEIFNAIEWIKKDLPEMQKGSKVSLVIDKQDIEVSNLKLSHLIAYELTAYPKHYFVIVKVKEQKGKDKRVFFVQNLFARNLNSFLDMSLDVLLKNTPEDIINQAGDEKNLTLESILKWGAADTFAGLIITEDQTRYGDLYPVESFFVMIKSLYDGGYLSETLAKLFSVAIEALRKRVILLPNSSLKEYLRYKQGKLSDIVPKDVRLSSFFKKFEVLDKSPNKLQGFQDLDPVWGKLLANNPSMRKDPGFILGVFNRLGSVFSAAHTRFMKLILDKIGLENIFQGASHSDDSLKVTNTQRIHNSALQSLRVSDMLRDLGFDGLGKQKYRIVRQHFTYKVKDIEDDNRTVDVVPADVIAKLLCILSMMVPRFVGQRMSFTKWGVSSIGEILQTYCIAGKMVPPLIRYASAIGADLPGKSPASDLNHVMSRVFQLYTGGAPLQCINDMMLILNVFTYLRFGIKPALENPYSRIPELGGYWYTYPYFLQTSGFLGNELRLYYLAGQSSALGDGIKSQLMVMLNTDEVFRQVDETDDLNIQSSIEVGEPEGFIGAPETRKDFFIRFNRKSRTLSSFFRLFKDFRIEFLNWDKENSKQIKKRMGKDWSIEYDSIFAIASKAGDLTKREQSNVIKRLNKLFLDRSMSKTDDRLMKTVSFLNRYITRSFQESYARIPDGALIINRIGYLNRKFSNPFSEKFKEKHVFLKGEKRFTVQKIWDTIASISQAGGNIPEENIKFYNLFRDLWSEFLFNLSVLQLDLKKPVKRPVDRDLFLSWRKFSPGFNLSFLKTHSASLLIAAAIQKNWLKSSNNFDLPIFKDVPKLRTDLGFSDTLDAFLKIVKKSGFSDKQLVSHASTLNRLFSSRLLITLSRFEGEGLQGSFAGLNWSARSFYPQLEISEVKLSDLKELGDKDLGVPATLRINNILISTLFDGRWSPDDLFFSIKEFETSVNSWILRETRMSVPSTSTWQTYNLFLTREILKEISKPGSSSLEFFWDGRENGDIGCKYQGEFYFLSPTVEAIDFQSKGYSGRTSNTNGEVSGFMFKMLSYFLHRKKNRLVSFRKQSQGGNGDFRISESDRLEVIGSKKVSSIFIVEKSRLDFLFRTQFGDRKSFFDLGSFTINTTPKYTVSAWRTSQFYSELRVFKRDRNSGGEETIVLDVAPETFNEEKFDFLSDLNTQKLKLILYSFGCLQRINRFSEVEFTKARAGDPVLSDMVYFFLCIAPFDRSLTLIEIIDILFDKIVSIESDDEVGIFDAGISGGADINNIISDSWKLAGFTFAQQLSYVTDPIKQFLLLHLKLAKIFSLDDMIVLDRYFLTTELIEIYGPSFKNKIMMNQLLLEKLYKPTLMLSTNFQSPVPNSVLLLKAEIRAFGYSKFLQSVTRFHPFPLLRHGRHNNFIGPILNELLRV